ncbi:protein-cysteine N-palmitoyltransferase Rasp [Prorops nasuta]|uniref:protein-cysteine N-palmitoyltransferase Rasp n=1 Tax=Prorops nasuta TaxID=863751 RepID=UPI0034CD9430
MCRDSVVLNKYEIIIYFFIWISAVGYSIYKVYLINTYFDNYLDLYNDFIIGWSWIGRKRDVSDEEWKIWIPLMINLIPWICIHLLIGQLLKRFFNIKLLYYWNIFISLGFLCFYIGVHSAVCIFLQPCLLFFLTIRHNKLVKWLIFTSYLFILHFLKIQGGIFQQWLNLSNEEHHILTIAMCWVHLRSISYAMDISTDYVLHINQLPSLKKNDLLSKIAYSLYLPTLFLGPLILYNEFVSSMNKPFKYFTLKDLMCFVTNVLRYAFWGYFTEFCMHFLYFNVLQHHPEILKDINTWAFYGFGYCTGQYFFNKYVIIYGLNGSICEIDGIKAPSKPRCIGRIHLYSDMWKYFDRGLYNFLVRYIYIPVSKSAVKKLFASFLCFTFVFLWHGMQDYIFIWSLLNYLGIVIENTAKAISKMRFYKKIEKKYFSDKNQIRIYCALASPLLTISAISNFYFFSGREIGNLFFIRIVNESWSNLLFLQLILYCCCHVSSYIKIMNNKNTKSMN